MDFTSKTLDELITRKAEIAKEVDAEGADLEALDSEVRAINEELEKRRNEATQRKEIRKAAAEEGEKTMDFKQETREATFTTESPEYRTAWLKRLAGKELTEVEKRAMDSGTSSGGYAIPTATMDRVIENLIKIAPMLGEIDLMRIPSNVTIPVEGTVNAAALHTENGSITSAEDTLVKISLGGYEICKLIPVSGKLDRMSINGFEAWIISNLSRSLAYIIENYIINGTGSSQPKGIAAAETWVDGTNGVDWASTAPTVAEIEELIGLQNSIYISNSKFLMNWKTFWNQVHALRDEKRPEIVSGDARNGFYIFGYPVLISSKVADGVMFFGDFFEGVKANFAEDITVERNESSGFRTNSIDYRGKCIFDCQTVPGRIVKGAASF